MRREGRQHGTVRTHLLLPDGLSPRAKSRVLNRLPGGRALAGVFARVPSKPTNHSKFTGRCGRSACTCCRESPAWKSKGKAKGQTKQRSRAAVELELEDEQAGGDCADEWAGEEDEMEEKEDDEIEVVDGHRSLVNNDNTTVECAAEVEDGDWFFVGNAIAVDATSDL